MENKKLSLSEILTTSPMLREIVDKVEQLAKLNRAVLKKLDPSLSTHCRVANLRNGILILTTTSPIWGHKLRFAKTDILTTLRSNPEWMGLKAIETEVRPAPEPVLRSTETGLPKPHLSSIGAYYIKMAATEINSLALQKALLRLAKRAPSSLRGPRHCEIPVIASVAKQSRSRLPDKNK